MCISHSSGNESRKATVYMSAFSGSPLDAVSICLVMSLLVALKWLPELFYFSMQLATYAIRYYSSTGLLTVIITHASYMISKEIITQLDNSQCS